MRGTTVSGIDWDKMSEISTHVPHAGHDRSVGDLVTIAYISTHVPHAGHDKRLRSAKSMRTHFNSRAPCGARLVRR